MNISFFCKFPGIIYEIAYYLFQACSVSSYVNIIIRQDCFYFDFRHIFHDLLFLYILHYGFEGVIGISKLDSV